MKKVLIFTTLSIILSMTGCSATPENETEVSPDTPPIQSQSVSEETKKEPIPVVTKSPEEIETEYKIATFKTFIENMQNPIEFSQISEEYIKNNPNLFPANSYEDVSTLINHEIGYKHIMKNSSKYEDTFLQTSGIVIDIEEITNGNRYVNVIHTLDDNLDSFYTFYIGELPDIFEEDHITIVGMPLGVSGFSNVGGGTTKIVVLAGSRVGKN